MDFKIEKNVPIPQGGANKKYQFKEMGVGDSVYIPDSKISNISGSLNYLRPKKFTTRSIDGGVSVWRIE